jgi:sulfide:quinone oxidoreductase
LVQDVEAGYVDSLAFVVTAPMAWPLPVYELALMTANRAYDMSTELSITILTLEDAPLAVFGEGASRAVAKLLADSKIEVITAVYCEIPEAGTIEIMPGDRRLEVKRVVALPELYGPAIPGVPEDREGFIPIDSHCQVRGAERVYAAGDATDFVIKHGGIAAQQADIAAQAIAALAGAPVEPQAFHPMIEGVLLTGAKPRYSRRTSRAGTAPSRSSPRIRRAHRRRRSRRGTLRRTSIHATDRRSAQGMSSDQTSDPQGPVPTDSAPASAPSVLPATTMFELARSECLQLLALPPSVGWESPSVRAHR